MSVSATSRLIGQAVGESLVERRKDAQDHRVVRVRLTRSGRNQVRLFERQVEDYFRSARPMVKDVLVALGMDDSGHRGRAGSSTLDRVRQLGIAGSAYAADATGRVAHWGVHAGEVRHTLVLLDEHGHLRPSQLAELLHFTTAFGCSEQA